MMKIISTLILSVIFTACIDNQKNLMDEYEPIDFEYEILDKSEFLKINDDIIYRASILISGPDTLFTYVQLADFIRKIGIDESIIAANLYRSRDCYQMEMDSIIPNFNTYYDCYLGYYDIVHRGINWKHYFKLDDIQFEGNLPMKINKN